MDSKIFLGKYRVAAEEMAAVGEIADSPVAYEAEEIDSGKNVVVEVVPAESLKASVRGRLETEAIAAKKLRHANIPALYDFGVEDDHFVYVTEDFEGTLAEEWVNAHGPMPAGPVLRIASQVVSALGAAAFHRINHHAINPGNLVLVPGQTAEGEWPLVKVLHFVGGAPKFSETDVSVAAFDKALHYASPEQLQRGVVDFRSELYSLGCTMWFLLTGAPPLTTPTGPMAEPLTQTGLAQTGLALDKISGLPKKIRRLLAQMLALNPEARPHDPLAFYRQLQDCLAEVERRGTISRKFGIPASSPAGVPRHRRFPVKALALAALFLAAAAVAALVVSGQLRHRRIVRSEEPIGKPIGVPEASASVTPVTANTIAIASNTAPPAAAMAESTSVPSASPTSAESPSPSTDSVMIASTAQAAVIPAPPAVSDSPKDPRSQELTPAAADNTNASPEIALSKPAEPTPGESPVAEVGPVAQQTEPEKIIMREVRRAEPADDEPEVRRAEPAPPDEGPESAASEATPPDPEPRVPAKPPAKKPERTAKPKRQAEKKSSSRQPMSESDDAMVQLRQGQARFVGVTPEGWWMLELPSNKIIIVPPPSSSP